MSLSTLSQLASDLISTLKLDCDHNSDVSDNKVDLYTLPDEVLLHIISHIPVKGVVTLRKTSKRLYGLTNTRSVWCDAVKRDVIDRGLPMAAAHSEGGLDAFSTQVLESFAVAVAKFNENWYSPKPRLRVTANVKAHTPLRETFPVDIREITFLNAHRGEFFVAITGETIVCFNIQADGSGARCIANWTHQGGVHQIVVNDDSEHIPSLVYVHFDRSSPETGWVWVMVLNKTLGTLRPCKELRVPREHRIHAMYGDLVVFGSPTGVVVWNTTGLDIEWFTRLRNHLYSVHDEVLAIKKVENYIIVVRTKRIEVYSTPIWSAEESRFSILGWIIVGFDITSGTGREAVITILPGAKYLSPSSPPPVTVLMLQTNHTLAQFDLVPKPSTLNNDRPAAPYDMSREPTRVFQVSPSAHRLKISRHGKGTWMQKQTLTGSDGEYTAQCVVGFDIYPPFHDLPPHPDTPNCCEISPVTDKLASVTGGGRDSDLRICQGHLYTRRLDVEGIADEKRITAAAVDDSMARLVVGDQSGMLQVLNFV